MGQETTDDVLRYADLQARCNHPVNVREISKLLQIPRNDVKRVLAKCGRFQQVKNTCVWEKIT